MNEPRKLHPHQALAMSRQQALETLAAFGSDDDKHMAQLMLAGPALTEEDERATFRPQPRRIVVATKLAIAERMLCAN